MFVGPRLREQANIRPDSPGSKSNFPEKLAEIGLDGRVSRIYDGPCSRYHIVLSLAARQADELPWGRRYGSLQKGDNMKLRHLAAIAVLLTLGCQSGDTPSTPPAEDVNATDTPAATSSVEPVTEDKLMTVSLNVTGMR